MNRSIFNRTLPASSMLTHLMDGNAVDASKVSQATKFLATDLKNLRAKSQGIAVACIYLSMSVAEGGPATGVKPALDLLTALGKSRDVKALAAWFNHFSNIRVRFDKDKKAWTGGVLDAKAKTYATPRPNEAMEVNFWEFGKDPREEVDYTTDKLAAQVKALITRATAANAKLNGKGKAALADLQKAAAKLAPAE